MHNNRENWKADRAFLRFFADYISTTTLSNICIQYQNTAMVGNITNDSLQQSTLHIVPCQWFNNIIFFCNQQLSLWFTINKT